MINSEHMELITSLHFTDAIKIIDLQIRMENFNIFKMYKRNHHIIVVQWQITLSIHIFQQL